MTARLLLIGTLLLSSAVNAPQRGHRDPTPQDRNPNPDQQFAVQRPESVQVQREADELAQLASTIPADVGQARKGVLAKDLKDRLKKIEKLSKRLRSELVLE